MPLPVKIALSSLIAVAFVSLLISFLIAVPSIAVPPIFGG